MVKLHWDYYCWAVMLCAKLWADLITFETKRVIPLKISRVGAHEPLIMMTSSKGNIFRVTGHLSPANSPHKGQWCGALMFSLICAWIDNWVNNRDAGDLRRHRAHYDVNLMTKMIINLPGMKGRQMPWKHACHRPDLPSPGIQSVLSWKRTQSSTANQLAVITKDTRLNPRPSADCHI